MNKRYLEIAFLIIAAVLLWFVYGYYPGTAVSRLALSLFAIVAVYLVISFFLRTNHNTYLDSVTILSDNFYPEKYGPAG
ncbi:hypothetical protein [Methanoregula sp.]|uniref:hypothetical protein n=1 Tax=Methanoregula sp. TaxID=2052170 RepID=UPI003BAECC31